ncbi:MAG: hypothetical protein ACRCY3_03305 [Sphingorhabdus sp.]
MSDDFPGIFAELRELMLKAAPEMVVTSDTPTNLTLKTPWTEARTKEPAWFGWIAIKKSYVAYHIMPLYLLPALNEAVPPALEKRRQGKTCFNFKKADKALFEDIRLLTEAAVRMEPELKAVIGE